MVLEKTLESPLDCKDCSQGLSLPLWFGMDATMATHNYIPLEEQSKEPEDGWGLLNSAVATWSNDPHKETTSAFLIP